VEEHKYYAHLSGGFLGVNGNITIGLLCLALIMQDALTRLGATIQCYHAQAGGDDFAYLLTCSKGKKEEVIELIRYTMENYVGKLKEFQTVELDDMPDGILEGVIFCRKRVILTQRNGEITLIGEPAVPIHSSLLPEGYIHRQDLQVKAWHELDSGLNEYERRTQDNYHITDTLRRLFLEVYPNIRPVRSKTIIYWTGSLKPIVIGTHLMSEEAYKRICNVEELVFDGHVVFQSFESKFWHAVTMDRVRLMKVNYQGLPCLAAVVPSIDGGALSRLRSQEMVGVVPDKNLLGNLLSIVEKS
jgi:hypothetical protein